MNAQVANHIEQQKEIVGDGRAYEVQLEERILRIVKRYPNSTPAMTKNRLGPFVVEPTFTQVIDRLIEEGKLNAEPTRVALTIAEAH
jgi:hypothetical protein